MFRSNCSYSWWSVISTWLPRNHRQLPRHCRVRNSYFRLYLEQIRLWLTSSRYLKRYFAAPQVFSVTWDPGPASTDSKKSISWGPRGLPKSLTSSPCSMWDMGSLSHRAVLDSGEGISRDVNSKFIVGSAAFPNTSLFLYADISRPDCASAIPTFRLPPIWWWSSRYL